MTSVFHLAYNITDLDAARRFYGGILGCREGRSAETWVDFDFFGHQISLHLGEPFRVQATGDVAGHKVPMPHLGVILEMDDWKALAAKLEAAGTEFILAPHIRWPGEPGEQATMFFTDPDGNPLEIKGHADMGTVFAI